jgi:hypothetical protein
MAGIVRLRRARRGVNATEEEQMIFAFLVVIGVIVAIGLLGRRGGIW